MSRSRARNVGPPSAASRADLSTSAAMPSSPALSATWAARTAGASGRGRCSPDSPRTLDAWSSTDIPRSGAPSSARTMPSAISETATCDDVGYSTSGAAARIARACPTSPSIARQTAARGVVAHVSASVSPTYASAPRCSIPFRAQMAAATFITRGRSGCSAPVSRPSTRRSGRPDVARSPRGLSPPACQRGRLAARFDRRGVAAPRFDGVGRKRLVGLDAATIRDPRVAEPVSGELECRLANGTPAARRRRPVAPHRPELVRGRALQDRDPMIEAVSPRERPSR